MSSIQGGLLSTVWMYGNMAWRCLESVKQLPLLCSKRNNDVQKSTDESQETQVSSTSASVVNFQAQPKNLKRAKRVRRKRSSRSNAEPTTKEPSKNTTEVLDGDKSNRNAERHTNTAILSPTSPKLIVPFSTSNKHEETSKNKNGNNSQKRRRTKGKPANDTLLPSKSLIADSQNMDKDLDEKQCSSTTKAPVVNCKLQKPNNIENKSSKSRLTVAGEEPKKDDDDFSEWHVVEKVRKPRASRPDDVLHAKGARQKAIHTKVLSNNEIKVKKSKNPRIPTAAANKTDFKSETKRQYDKIEELKRSVKLILKRLTEENVVELTTNLAALPIDTMEHLQTTANIIFEKVLYERNVVHLYASLCSDIKSLQVTCDDGKSTASFLSLILKNCQKQFKVDRAHRADDVKKLDEINSCKDHEKKKKLRLEYEVNERRLRRRSIGNCRFIGELFKKNLIKTSIITYCIADLLEQSTECSLECLCILLKTAGTDLEKTCKLNETFDKLKSLTLKKTISLRMRYIIKSTIDLWKKS